MHLYEKIYSMSYVKNLLHVVWSTKKWEPYLTEPTIFHLIDFMKKDAKETGIYIDQLNGVLDHMHCLLNLSHKEKLVDVMRIIKSHSSKWLNQIHECPGRTVWQDGFFAVSVGERGIQPVRRYIRNQQVHHRDKTLRHEVEVFARELGIGVEEVGL